MSSTIYVDQNYEMNPETEDLLLDGHLLREGMVVLVAMPELRIDLNILVDEEYWREKIVDRHTRRTFEELADARKRWSAESKDYDDDAMNAVCEALRRNRWCRVSNVQIRRYNYLIDHVTFLGTYDDRTEFHHLAEIDTPWFIKKDRK